MMNYAVGSLCVFLNLTMEAHTNILGRFFIDTGAKRAANSTAAVSQRLLGNPGPHKVPFVPYGTGLQLMS